MIPARSSGTNIGASAAVGAVIGAIAAGRGDSLGGAVVGAMAGTLLGTAAANADATEAQRVQRSVNARSFDVRLAPGAGARLTLRMKRYANQPTLALPWGT